jgi:hypothetical protein
MWPGTRFRVTLETESLTVVQFNTLQTVVKQGSMRGANIFR